jgi:hypothetical protein
MEQHWDEVEDAVNLMTYILKRYNKNGIDMRFTISSARYKAKTSREFLHAVKQRRPTKLQGGANNRLSSISNMGAQLQLITDEYRKRLDSQHGYIQALGPLARLHKVKKTIVYILTDGKWQKESPVEGPIVSLVRNILANGFLENQFGIQFIRFGNDPQGIDRLQKLDNIHKHYGMTAYVLNDMSCHIQYHTDLL